MSRLPFAGSGQEAATHKAASGPAIPFAKRLWVNSFGIHESPLWRLKSGLVGCAGAGAAPRRHAGRRKRACPRAATGYCYGDAIG
jgi:hypothetical protein